MTYRIQQTILWLALILPITSSAQNAGLTLSLSDSSMFTFSLGDKNYSTPGTVAVLHDLFAGTYKLKVIKRMRLGNSIVEQPVFDNEIFLEAGRHTDAFINQYNQFVIIATSEKQQNGNQTRTLRSQDLSQTGQEGMESGHFSAFIGDLREVPQERKRFETAKGRISLSTLNCSQLKLVMQEFESEDNRIRLAAEGSSRVSDPSNFDLIYTALRHPSSVRKLQRQINRIQ